MKKALLLCSILLVVSSCANNGSESVVRTETLVSASSEKVSFPVADAASVKDIENWISNGDNRPSNAQVSCLAKNPACMSLRALLKKQKIAVTEVPFNHENGSTVSIIYNRILARSCPIESFGCSTSLNSLRMVTNREQFTKPAMSDYQDAASAVKAVGEHFK